MRVFLSADIEGVNGVVAATHYDTAGGTYGHARSWMVEEVNAAIRGARIGGATEFVVKDAHGPATNILLHDLEAGASLIGGWGPVGSMVEGVDASFSALMLVGYHARVGTERGVLSHTIGGAVRGVRINGTPTGEAGLSAMYAGHFGVPLAMIAGDAAAVEEAEALCPGVVGVAVKSGLTRKGALMLPIMEARRRVEEGAQRAIESLGELKPFRPALPIRLEVDLPLEAAAELCSFVPSVERVGERTVGYEACDAIDATRVFEVLLTLAGTVKEW